MPEKAAIYARVSTEEQNLEGQVERLKEWAEKEDYDYDLYSEEVSSVAERPKFNELIENIPDSDYTALAVTDLDRFGRSTRDILEKIDRLSEQGVGFVCIDQGIDTRDDSAMGEIMSKVTVTILSAFAEFERKMMLKRQKEGIKKAKEEGRMGRPEKLDEEDVQQVIQWREKGVSVKDICLRLEEYHGIEVGKSTIYNYLEKYSEEK